MTTQPGCMAWWPGEGVPYLQSAMTSRNIVVLIAFCTRAMGHAGFTWVGKFLSVRLTILAVSREALAWGGMASCRSGFFRSYIPFRVDLVTSIPAGSILRQQKSMIFWHCYGSTEYLGR